MPKVSKPPRATKPKPPKAVLSNAAKVARRERTNDYKKSKASVVAAAVSRKEPRYYNEDESANNDSNEEGDDEDEEDKEDKEDDEDKEDKEDDEDEDEDEGNPDKGGREVSNNSEGPQPYKSKDGNYVFIPDETGECIRFSMLDRPEGSLKQLDALMKLDGPENKALWKGLQGFARGVVRHVARNIPNCTYPMLTDEQRVHITFQVRKAYPIVLRYRGNWGLKEIVIRALTHHRDLQARITKAGGHAAWCEKLKSQREAKKASKGSIKKGKGKGKARLEPDPSGTKTSTQVAIPESDDDTPVSKPSTSKAKARRRIEDTEDEGNSDEEPTSAPKPALDKQKATKRPPKTPSTESLEADEESNMAPEPLKQGSKAFPPASSTIAPSTPPNPAAEETVDEDASSTRGTQEDLAIVESRGTSHPVIPSKSTPTPPTPKPQETTPDSEEEDAPTPQPTPKRVRPIPRPPPSPAPSNVPTANTTTKRKATSTDDTAPKRRNLNGASVPEPPLVGIKARSKTKSSAPNPNAGGSSTGAGTQSANKKGKRGGRQAKQELIDENDSLLRGETLPIPERTTRRTTRANRG